MADKAISELIEATQITALDLFVLEQSGTAKKLTGQTLENWLLQMADGHGGIHNIEKVGTVGLVDTYRITLADTSIFDFAVTNGKSIVSVSKSGTAGLVDTYDITYNDGTTEQFTVTNGAKGDTGQAWYVHIKYAAQEPTPESHTMGDIPDAWMGVYSGTSEDAPTDYAAYKWYRIEGAKGDTGDAATVQRVEVVYQLSASGDAPPTGEWLANIPAPEQGKYLWSRTTTEFNSGLPIVTYGAAYLGRDGAGTVNTVCGIAADEDGDVPLKGGNIPFTDDVVQGATFRMGIENGKLYIEEV